MPSNPMQAMWMGPRGGERWMPSPDSGATFTPIGWTATSGGTQQIGGGLTNRRSKTTHRDYPMTWSNYSRMVLGQLEDMYSGALGPGLIYFVDLMAADLNVLPAQWAFPASACYDGIPLIGTARPTNLATPTNAFGYPQETAHYSLYGSTLHPLYIPIPPGYDAWFGASGVFSGAANTGIRVTPILPGNTPTTPLFPTLLPVTSSTLVNVDLSSTTYQGLVIDVVPTPSVHNLLNNPNGRYATTGYVVSGVGNIGQDANADTYFQATAANSSGTGGIGIETMVIGGGKLVPSTTYTFSASVLASAGSGGAISYVPKIQVSGTGLATSVQTVGAASPWNRISVTFTTTASGSVTFSVLNTGAAMASGNVVAFQDAQVERSSTMSNYGDGTYPDWSWVGAANNSTSNGVTPDLLDLSGLVCQILPTGTTPTPGNWIGGRGNSGCDFLTAPAITAISSVHDQVGAAAHLAEVGDFT